MIEYKEIRLLDLLEEVGEDKVKNHFRLFLCVTEKI